MFVVLIGLVSLGIAPYFIQSRNASLDRQHAVSKSLAAASEALLGYAAAATRPGELPCPDRNNDGLAEPSCNTPAERIGRLPWVTLGIEDPWLSRGTGGPTDNGGETLWYAVADAFRPGSATPINADSTGNLIVNNAWGPPLTNIVAVLIAPGPPLPGQTRTFGAQNIVANYLEAENSSIDATFTGGQISDTFNDVVHPISQDALMRVVTARVANAARLALQAYFSAPPDAYFPRARPYGAVNCDPTLTQGQLPMTPSVDCKGYKDWPTGSLPSWFIDNQWDQFVHYAVTPDCSDLTDPCTSTDGNITVTGMGTPVPAVVIVTGRALGSQARPCAVVADCLEAAENIDGDSIFVHSSADANDRLVVVPIP